MSRIIKEICETATGFHKLGFIDDENFEHYRDLMITIDNRLYHKGYSGSIEYSKEDKCWHGKILNTKDLITYEGYSIKTLNEEFICSVEEYIIIRKVKNENR